MNPIKSTTVVAKTHNMEFNLHYFQAKERQLKVALFKVKDRLFKATQENPLPNWNRWHDLQDRLEDRLKAHWDLYYDWHWSTQGWNAY